MTAYTQDNCAREAALLTSRRVGDVELLHAQIDLAEERVQFRADASALEANWQQLRDAQAAFHDYTGRVLAVVTGGVLAGAFWAVTQEPLALCGAAGLGCLIWINPLWSRLQRAQTGEAHDAVGFTAGDPVLVSRALAGRDV